MMKYNDPPRSFPGVRSQNLNSRHLQILKDNHAVLSSNQRTSIAINSSPSGSISVIVPRFQPKYPGQIMVAREETPMSDDDDLSEEESAGGAFSITARTVIPRFFRRKSNFDMDLFTFSDMDYMLPREVREILQQEGVDNSTMEAWLKRREIRHKRAEALRQFEMAKSVKRKAVRFPPIKKKKLVQDGQTQVSPLPVKEPRQTSLPDVKKKPPKIELLDEDINYVMTEVEEIKWRSEQQLERMSTPAHNYTPPRIVLISSRISWCRAMARAVRTDGHVLSVVYDFESWSFQDLIGECKCLLDSYRIGCKAQSLMIICKGGPGYMYILQNYVVTPQKLMSSKYKKMKEFWHTLGDQISKLTPENAYIHILGAEMEGSVQGETLKVALYKSIRPNKVKVECISETSDTGFGKDKIELYFDYRKYLLWRSRVVHHYDLQETQDESRSWSSLEDGSKPRERHY